MRRTTDPEYDRTLATSIDGPLAGVDEVGRGALAGPVVAAAVVLPHDVDLPGITDSKRMTRLQREEGYDRILNCAVAWSVGIVGPDVVDRINVRQGTLQAMREAVAALRLFPAMVLVDGRDDPGVETVVRTVIGGDGISLSIAAASVVAKVTRDRIMTDLAGEHPVYGFERHVGYATDYHRRAIRAHGPATPHRMSFLRSILQERLPL